MSDSPGLIVIDDHDPLPDIEETLHAVNDGIDKLKAEHKRALELLEWALDALKSRSAAAANWSISVDPNYTIACLTVADAKARGII
jgi:hypothetical protein